MKVAVICLVIFGLIAAVCAAVLVATLARPTGPAAAIVAKAEEEVSVLVATRELQPMSVVDGPSVAIKKVPKSQVPQDALINAVQVVGKVLTDRVVEGQLFTKACFAREGTGVYLATALPPGKRAISITLADWSGMAGLLYPGSVVDVVVSFKSLGVPGRDSTELLSTTLLQSLQVLAIGSQSVANDNYKDKEPGALATRGQVNTRMVTLLVDPKQAEILQLAMQAGSISLSMRNPLDAKQDSRRLTRAREISPAGATPSVVISSDEDPFSDPAEPLRAAAAAAKAPAAPANAWETTIIRGRESQVRTFPLPGAAGRGDSTAREGELPDDAAPADEPTEGPAVGAEPAGVGVGA